MGNSEIDYTRVARMDSDIIVIKQYSDYVGSTLNDTINTIEDLEKRVAELETILSMVKRIDWTTVKYKEAETFQ
jgi:archaellum component FlaC